MKKAYSKPQIFFDSFELAQGIAAGCEWKNETFGEDCGVDFGPFTVFVSGVTGCAPSAGGIEVEDGSSQFNGLCYHVPTDINNVFSS